MSKKAIIICSYLEGTIQGALEFSNWALKDSIVICADGGINLALSEKIPPDYLIGDFDSLDKSKLDEVTSSYPNLNILPFPPEKDLTDTALSIEFAISKGASEILIIGGMGGRVDHTLAVIQNLAHYAKANWDIHSRATVNTKDPKPQIFCALCNERNFVYITDEPSFTLPKINGKYFSLFSFDKEIEGLTIAGAKYPLSDYQIKNTFPIGVSNEFIQNKEVYIKKSKGLLIVVISKD